MPEHPPKIYVLGVTLGRIQDSQRLRFDKLPTATPIFQNHNFDSLALLHYLNRNDLAEKFPSCSNLFFRSQLIGPALFDEERLDLRLRYPFIEEANIKVPSLVAHVLIRLPGLSQTDKLAVLERVRRFFNRCAAENGLLTWFQRRDVAWLNERLTDLQRLSQVEPSADLHRPLENLANEFLSLDTEIIRLPYSTVGPHRHLAFRDINAEHYSLGEAWLLEFIANLPHLVSLSIKKSGLSQDFFDRLLRLPGLATSLNRLILKDYPNGGLTINLDLLLRFKRLHRFSTNLITRQLMIDDERTREFISSRLKFPGCGAFELDISHANHPKVLHQAFSIIKYRDSGIIRYSLYYSGHYYSDRLRHGRPSEYLKHGFSLDRLMRKIIQQIELVEQVRDPL